MLASSSLTFMPTLCAHTFHTKIQMHLYMRKATAQPRSRVYVGPTGTIYCRRCSFS